MIPLFDSRIWVTETKHIWPLPDGYRSLLDGIRRRELREAEQSLPWGGVQPMRSFDVLVTEMPHRNTDTDGVEFADGRVIVSGRQRRTALMPPWTIHETLRATADPDRERSYTATQHIPAYIVQFAVSRLWNRRAINVNRDAIFSHSNVVAVSFEKWISGWPSKSAMLAELFAMPPHLDGWFDRPDWPFLAVVSECPYGLIVHFMKVAIDEQSVKLQILGANVFLFYGAQAVLEELLLSGQITGEYAKQLSTQVGDRGLGRLNSILQERVRRDDIPLHSRKWYFHTLAIWASAIPPPVEPIGLYSPVSLSRVFNPDCWMSHWLRQAQATETIRDTARSIMSLAANRVESNEPQDPSDPFIASMRSMDRDPKKDDDFRGFKVIPMVTRAF